GLVGWWRAEANANDNFATNHGTLLNNVTYAAGEVGQAFSFNETNSAVVIPANPLLDVGNGPGFTVEAWINPSNVTNALPLFEWNDGNYWGVHFYIAPGQPTAGSPGPAGPGQLYANVVDVWGGWHQLGSPAGAVAAGVFQHIALTYDQGSGVATIYRNGQIVSQLGIGSFPLRTGYDLYLGRRQAPAGEACSFAGLMDEPSIYNRALTQTEIRSIVNARSLGKCNLPPNHPPVANASATETFLISLNATDATAVLDGSQSSDADNDPLQYQWSAGNTPLASGVVAVVTLPVGTNAITLSVSDGRASSNQNIAIEVATTAQAVQRLADLVNEDVAKAKALTATLSAAIKSIDRSKPDTAINQLQAFQNQVNAQVAPLDPALAAKLIADAQDIIDALSNPGATSGAKVATSLSHANGKLHVKFNTNRRATYIIETSTDLKNWVKIGVAKDLGNGSFDLEDAPGTGNAPRFYRVVTP
ncbi:MAG: hypothetical protein RLY20_2471, partial [Verrucomicrobiota bacterium]